MLLQSIVPNPAITLVNSGITSKMGNTITYIFVIALSITLQGVVTFYYYFTTNVPSKLRQYQS